MKSKLSFIALIVALMATSGMIEAQRRGRGRDRMGLRGHPRGPESLDGRPRHERTKKRHHGREEPRWGHKRARHPWKHPRRGWRRRPWVEETIYTTPTGVVQHEPKCCGYTKEGEYVCVVDRITYA